MKTFIVINGKVAHLIERENLKEAIISAENTCDCSKEVIVREVESFEDFRK